MKHLYFENPPDTVNGCCCAEVKQTTIMQHSLGNKLSYELWQLVIFYDNIQMTTLLSWKT